ncbi:hypothetical protein SLE2022_283580 [Rubroshorea leprosula]
MYLEFNRFSFMTVLNSDMFFSEKDLNAMEFDLLVRPALQFPDDQECETAPSQDVEEARYTEGDDRKLSLLELEIKAPSLDLQNDGNGEGLKTPTALDHRIPAKLKCPPAPRKPKSLPSAKRKEVLRRRILLDLTKEIESLFPPALRADLGNKIKKVRQGTDEVTSSNT